jgi:3-oxoacyl-[acyl-carrier protein] reductase
MSNSPARDDAERDPGRVALVTGGSGGIGRAIVVALARRGVRVLFTYNTNQEAADALADELGRDLVAPMRYRLLDDDPAEVVAAAVDTWGSLTTVIVNAGIWYGGVLTRTDPAQWWNLIETNLRSTSEVTRAALPVLRRDTDTSITLMSSVVGLNGFAGDTAYSSAKAAMVGFARSLAKETARHGTRVNVVAPGFVETAMTSEIGATARERIQHDTTMGRFGTAEEIADATVFLAEDASYCTGVVLPVDGGWSI